MHINTNKETLPNVFFFFPSYNFDLTLFEIKYVRPFPQEKICTTFVKIFANKIRLSLDRLGNHCMSLIKFFETTFPPYLRK